MTALPEQNALEYPALAEDVEIDLLLQNKAGVPCPENGGKVYNFAEQRQNAMARESAAADAYNYDALTCLYNRSRYERDVAAFKEAGNMHIVCVYIDAVGLHEINNHLGHQAEHAMRRHKAEFYRQNGAERQMRTLNHKLEKRDTSQFLNVIAPRYKGVYMVDPKDDSCRYIYIPKYFQKTLEENGGRFSPSIRTYCDEFVRPEYRESFRALIDYDRVRSDLEAGMPIDYIYQKVDDGWIRLKITIYDRNAPDSGEMQWIFMDATPQN